VVTSSRIVHREAQLLTADELRALVNVCNGQGESVNDDLDAQGLLDLFWAASDAGYVSWEGWAAEPDDAQLPLAALRRVRNGSAIRLMIAQDARDRDSKPAAKTASEGRLHGKLQEDGSVSDGSLRRVLVVRSSRSAGRRAARPSSCSACGDRGRDSACHWGCGVSRQVVLRLYSYHMGDVSEADFAAWARYVESHLEIEGLDILVDQAPFGAAGEDALSGDCTDDEREAVLEETRHGLWDAFCSDDDAWPSAGGAT
jgi:hypothetical protein